MRIAIVTPVLVNGDAVSNDVVGMKAALEATGCAADIYANHATFQGVQTHPIADVERAMRAPNDLLIYHFSVGWDVGLNLLQKLKCKKVVKYHNVTPPQFFEDVNTDYANVCRAGREMLHHVANCAVDRFLSDSNYNMLELVGAGAPRPRNFVVPPFHQIDHLLEADAEIAALDSMRDGQTNILMVGRLAPNKGHVDLIEAFARYHLQYNRDSRLLIVGKHDPRLKAYIDQIYNAIADAGLDGHVVFTQEVSEQCLKACFLAAHVFAIASEHEGFCVPAIEAMAHQVPVAAYASTAITETVGDAGIVWPERDPQLLAASLNKIVREPGVAEGLGRLGWTRYHAHYRNEVIGERFLTSVQALLSPSESP